MFMGLRARKALNLCNLNRLHPTQPLTGASLGMLRVFQRCKIQYWNHSPSLWTSTWIQTRSKIADTNQTFCLAKSITHQTPPLVWNKLSLRKHQHPKTMFRLAWGQLKKTYQTNTQWEGKRELRHHTSESRSTKTTLKGSRFATQMLTQRSNWSNSQAESRMKWVTCSKTYQTLPSRRT